MGTPSTCSSAQVRSTLALTGLRARGVSKIERGQTGCLRFGGPGLGKSAPGRSPPWTGDRFGVWSHWCRQAQQNLARPTGLWSGSRLRQLRLGLFTRTGGAETCQLAAPLSDARQRLGVGGNPRDDKDPLPSGHKNQNISNPKPPNPKALNLRTHRLSKGERPAATDRRHLQAGLGSPAS